MAKKALEVKAPEEVVDDVIKWVEELSSKLDEYKKKYRAALAAKCPNPSAHQAASDPKPIPAKQHGSGKIGLAIFGLLLAAGIVAICWMATGYWMAAGYESANEATARLQQQLQKANAELQSAKNEISRLYEEKKQQLMPAQKSKTKHSPLMFNLVNISLGLSATLFFISSFIALANKSKPGFWTYSAMTVMLLVLLCLHSRNNKTDEAAAPVWPGNSPVQQEMHQTPDAPSFVPKFEPLKEIPAETKAKRWY